MVVHLPENGGIIIAGDLPQYQDPIMEEDHHLRQEKETEEKDRHPLENVAENDLCLLGIMTEPATGKDHHLLLGIVAEIGQPLEKTGLKRMILEEMSADTAEDLHLQCLSKVVEADQCQLFCLEDQIQKKTYFYIQESNGLAHLRNSTVLETGQTISSQDTGTIVWP